MTNIPTVEHVEKKCIDCGVKLTDFVAYIPGKGDACLKCYIKYELDEKFDPGK